MCNLVKVFHNPYTFIFLTFFNKKYVLNVKRDFIFFLYFQGFNSVFFITPHLPVKNDWWKTFWTIIFFLFCSDFSFLVHIHYLSLLSILSFKKILKSICFSFLTWKYYIIFLFIYKVKSLKIFIFIFEYYFYITIYFKNTWIM